MNHLWQIIVNPNALTKKRAEIFKKILHEFDLEGIKYKINPADGPNKGIETAKLLCRAGARHLMVCGGDGSINKAVNGIYNAGINTEEVFLAILPLGTGNDFCRSLHYPTIEKMPAVFKSGHFVPTDVGIVETLNGNEVIAKRHFINIAGFAFDASTIAETVGKKPKLFPGAVYLLKLVKVLLTFKPSVVTLKTKDKTLTDSIFTIAVGNAQYNGNGMRQVPMADLHDRMLDVVAIRKISPLKVVANIGRLFSGEHIHLKEVTVLHTNSLEIKSGKSILGEVEGELLEKGDYRLTLSPTRVNILTAM